MTHSKYSKEKIIKRLSENKEVAEEELENLTRLKRIIDEYIEGKVTTIKVVLLKEFAKELGEAIENLHLGTGLK